MIRRVLASLLLAGLAGAQQVLYEPLPPAGSAYLRVVNATPGPLSLPAGLVAAATLGTESAQRVSRYVVQENVAEREVTLPFPLGAAGGATTLRLEPGSFNTLIVVADGPGLRAMQVADQTQFNQTRARLSFYNATADCADARLTLEPEGQAIFADVPAGAVRMRSVNPVTAQVRPGCGGTRGAPFALGGMQAGGQYSIWLLRLGEQPTAFLARDETMPWRR